MRWWCSSRPSATRWSKAAPSRAAWHAARAGPPQARRRRPPGCRADIRPGPEISHSAARRHRHQGVVAGHQRPDHRRAGARPDRRPAPSALATRSRQHLDHGRAGRPCLFVPLPDWADSCPWRSTRSGSSTHLRPGHPPAARGACRPGGLRGPPRAIARRARLSRASRPVDRALALRPGRPRARHPASTSRGSASVATSGPRMTPRRARMATPVRLAHLPDPLTASGARRPRLARTAGDERTKSSYSPSSRAVGRRFVRQAHEGARRA